MEEPTIKRVVIERWDCGNKGHNHITKAVAQRCMAIPPRSIYLKTCDEYRVRNLTMLGLAQSGAKIKEIATLYDLSATRVSEIINREKWRIRDRRGEQKA